MGRRDVRRCRSYTATRTPSTGRGRAAGVAERHHEAGGHPTRRRPPRRRRSAPARPMRGQPHRLDHLRAPAVRPRSCRKLPTVHPVAVRRRTTTGRVSRTWLRTQEVPLRRTRMGGWMSPSRSESVKSWATSPSCSHPRKSLWQCPFRWPPSAATCAVSCTSSSPVVTTFPSAVETSGSSRLTPPASQSGSKVGPSHRAHLRVATLVESDCPFALRYRSSHRVPRAGCGLQPTLSTISPTTHQLDRNSPSASTIRLVARCVGSRVGGGELLTHRSVAAQRGDRPPGVHPPGVLGGQVCAPPIPPGRGADRPPTPPDPHSARGGAATALGLRGVRDVSDPAPQGRAKPWALQTGDRSAVRTTADPMMRV